MCANTLQNFGPNGFCEDLSKLVGTQCVTGDSTPVACITATIPSLTYTMGSFTTQDITGTACIILGSTTPLVCMEE